MSKNRFSKDAQNEMPDHIKIRLLKFFAKHSVPRILKERRNKKENKASM